jgi:peptidyl-prolyl cis-trans isomerase SurA
MRAVLRSLVLAGSALSLVGVASAQKEPGWVVVERVVAVVNQDVVLASEVKRRADSIPAGAAKREEIEKAVLEEIIDEILFVQQASAARIEVSDGEVDAAIGDIKQQNKLDDAGLAVALEAQGYTLERYRVEIRNQIVRLRAINLLIRPRVTVDDAEVQAFYKKAKAADPKLGPFDKEKEKIRQRILEENMAIEAKRWLAEQRAVSFIAVRQ